MQVFRQRNPEFVRMLNDIRTGNGRTAIQQLLQLCTRPLPEQNGVKPTQLFSKNADVDTVNAAELSALEGEEVCWLICTVSIRPNSPAESLGASKLFHWLPTEGFLDAYLDKIKQN